MPWLTLHRNVFADSSIFVEEGVNEVRKQAVIELRKAMAAAELKANELVAQEKLKMERSIKELKLTAREEALAVLNKQLDSQEVSGVISSFPFCWYKAFFFFEGTWFALISRPSTLDLLWSGEFVISSYETQ